MPPAGSVTGVVVQRDGGQETYQADIVALCAGATNSAKILLRSASDAHPDGLANGSGQVGRNYMFHNSKAMVALGKERNDTVYQKTLSVNDFYLPGNGREWPLGNIQMLGKSNAEAMRGEEPHLTKLAPQLEPVGGGRARGRPLADHRGPAQAGQPGAGGPEWQGAPGLHAGQRGGSS